MGVASQYAPVPPSYDAVLDQRSDKVRARDFGVDAALLAEEMEDDDEEDEYGDFRRARRRRDEGRSSCCTLIRRALLLAALVTLALALGFCAGTKHERMKVGSSSSSSISGHAQQQLSEGTSSKAGGMLPPQSLVPDIPIKDVKFGFPTPYEEKDIAADKLWDALMPLGAGFIRVPHPRKYDMHASKPIEDDPEEAEIYSLSSLHQLHCLAVIRDVIKHYQSPDPAAGPSRFIGHGHEWHCIDYIRQGIMCAADTTLDFAEGDYVDPIDGTVRESRGFTGNNSTHQCRDWDAMVEWAVEHRAGNRSSIV